MSNVKNYTEQSGDKTVIGGVLEISAGGKLTFDGVELNRAEKQDDSNATTVAALKDDFNALLVRLKNAGLMGE